MMPAAMMPMSVPTFTHALFPTPYTLCMFLLLLHFQPHILFPRAHRLAYELLRMREQLLKALALSGYVFAVGS